MVWMAISVISLVISCVSFYKVLVNKSAKSILPGFIFFMVSLIIPIITFHLLRVFIFAGILVLTVIIASIISSSNYKREIKEIIEAEEKKREAEVESMKSGNWEFPSLKFFQECSSSSVSPEKTDDFSKQKVHLIAQSYYISAGLPKECWKIYDEKLIQYYKIGQEESEAIIKEKNEKAKRPTEGELNFEDIVLHYVGTEARTLKGIEKRKLHLDALIMQRQSIIDSYVKLVKDSDSLGRTTVNSEKSWVPSAVIGGLVGGTAGAVLGAMDTMNKNERRREQDASFNETSSWLRKQGNEVSCKVQPYIDAAINVRNIFRNELEECDKKVVIFPEEDLTEKVIIENLGVEKTSGNTLKLSLKIRMNGDLPNDKMRLDGVIHARIYNEDVFVDDIYIPLPVYGLLPNKYYTIYGVCKKSIAAKTGYTAKISELLNFSFVEELTNICIENDEFYNRIPIIQ